MDTNGDIRHYPADVHSVISVDTGKLDGAYEDLLFVQYYDYAFRAGSCHPLVPGCEAFQLSLYYDLLKPDQVIRPVMMVPHITTAPGEPPTFKGPSRTPKQKNLDNYKGPPRPVFFAVRPLL